jgi:uncharacterized protein YjbK
MRDGVLSDSYIEEFCKEFRPVPLDKVKILKIDHPQNLYSGIKPIYNQTIVRPATINTMVANIHRANSKAGDITSSHEELLEEVVQEVKSEESPVAQVPVFSSPSGGRGGKRKGSGRMTNEEKMVKTIAKYELEFEEDNIPKTMVKKALREGGQLGAVKALKSSIRQESAKDVIERILKKVEKQIDDKEKSK